MKSRVVLLLWVLLPIYCFSQSSDQEILEDLNEQERLFNIIRQEILPPDVSLKDLERNILDLENIQIKLTEHDGNTNNPTIKSEVFNLQSRVEYYLTDANIKRLEKIIDKSNSIKKTERIIGGVLFAGSMGLGAKLYMDSMSSYELYNNAVTTNSALDYYDSAEQYLQQSLITIGSGLVVSSFVTFIMPLITNSTMDIKNKIKKKAELEERRRNLSFQ